MIGRRNGLVVLGIAALALYAGHGLWPDDDIAFTREAAQAPRQITLRPAVSTTSVHLPLNLSLMRTEAAKALDAALAAAPTELGLTRNGPIKFAANGSRLWLKLPVRARLGARATDQQALIYAVPFSVDLKERRKLEAALWHRPILEGVEGTRAAASPAQLGMIAAALQPIIAISGHALQRTLSRSPVDQAIKRAWSVLAQPLALGADSSRYLRGNPQYVGGGRLVTRDGRFAYRLSLVSRLSVSDIAPRDREAAIPFITYSPDARWRGSRVRVAFQVGLEEIERATVAAFESIGPFETKSGRYGQSARVKVHATRAYPAQGQIGVALRLDATATDGRTHTGTAHVAGTPVLSLAHRQITLTDVVMLPRQPHHRGVKPIAGLARLGAEPFVSIVARAARVDVAPLLDQAKPRVQALLNRRLDEQLTLETSVVKIAPVSFELSRTGAYLLVDAVGEVRLIFEGLRPEQTQPSDFAVAVRGQGSLGSAISMDTSATMAEPTPAASSPTPMMGELKPFAPAPVAESDGLREPAPNNASRAARRRAAARKRAQRAKPDWIPFGLE